MRKWILATAVLLVTPMVGAAAVIVTAPVPEQLVEGHTVFTVIQVRETGEEQTEEFAAAVAVLIRENVDVEKFYDRFPGVLWFNDQYLRSPESGTTGNNPPVAEGPRYPCGAVIAVNAGDVVPTDANGVPTVPATAAYLESYRITDPNEKTWHVDRWSYDPDADATTANSYLLWSTEVATSGSGNAATPGAGYSRPDDGSACGSAITDGPPGCSYPLLPIHDTTPQRPADYAGPWPTRRSDTYYDSGGNAAPGAPPEEDQELRRSCVRGLSPAPGYPSPGLVYNAVLFFFLEDLTAFGGVKDHGVASADATGCQNGVSGGLWPCPGGDDNAEGNSHPFNRNREWPEQLSEGRDNHGGSTGCGPSQGGGAQDTHATCNVDIYFGYKAAPLPAVRAYPRVFDNEGKTAPYHCHDAIQTCNEEEYNPAL